MAKKKKKPASAKRGKKKSVKMKDLPAKRLENREVIGRTGAANLSATNLESRQTLGGGALQRPDALNLGL